MKTNKRIFIISVAIVAVIALTLGISFAAWDNSTAKEDYVVAVGSNAVMTVNSTPSVIDEELVPKEQIGLGIKDTKKVEVKTLSTITITLNKDAEVNNDLVVVYGITAIYSVPKNNTKSFADIKKMDADELKTAGIIDLNVEHEGNKRYLTGDEVFDSSKPKGTDLRINLIDASNGTKNYKAGEEIPFDPDTFSTAKLTLSMEFTRKANEEFKTMNDFLGKKIMIEITFTLKAKTTAPAPTPTV